MGTVVHRRTTRMRETQQQLPSGLPYAGFVAMSPMSLQKQQPGSAKTKHILSRYRPIAPKPVAGMSADQTTTDTHSVSTLSTDNASTTEYKPSKRSRKRAADLSVTKAGKKKQPQKAKPEDAIQAPTAELHGYDLTPLLPVGVAQKFGPGGWQRFHDSFDPRDVSVSVSLSLSSGTQSPREDVALGLHVGVARDDGGFLQSSENEVSVSRLFQPRESQFLKAGPSLSTSFGTDSEVCSVEDSDKSDVVTLSLLPDTPSNVNARASSSSALSTLSLLRPDARWGTTTWETPAAATSSDLNTSLTMFSTGRWLEISPATPSTPVTPVTPVHSTLEAVDARDLEQRHGASCEAVLLTDARGQILWANAVFHRLSNERTSSRAQAIGPHIDPLGIRTQLASLTFQPPFPALKTVVIGGCSRESATGTLEYGFMNLRPVLQSKPHKCQEPVVGNFGVSKSPPHEVLYTEGRPSGLKWKFLRLQYMSRDAVALGLENKEATADEKNVGANTFDRSDDLRVNLTKVEKKAYQEA